MVVDQDRTPNWGKWRHVPNVELWEAVALSLDIEPNLVKLHCDGWRSNAHFFEESELFDERIFVAERNLSTGGALKPMTVVEHRARCQVSLASFAAWACSINWEIPQQLAETHAVTQSASWPWGDHETTLLGNLAGAAYEFWSTYDLEQPSTAPKNKDVSEWLVSKGVSRRVAEVMAQILRADGLRTGPRR